MHKLHIKSIIEYINKSRKKEKWLSMYQIRQHAGHILYCTSTY